MGCYKTDPPLSAFYKLACTNVSGSVGALLAVRTGIFEACSKYALPRPNKPIRSRLSL